jgi:hypothetical protein
MSRRSLADWKVIVEQQASSGLTAAQFCRENSLNAKYYSFYKCKFNKTKPAFIKVKPTTKPSVTTLALTCNGIAFQCDNSCDPKFIAQLLRELQT